MDLFEDAYPACSECGRRDWSTTICSMGYPPETSKPMGVCDDCNRASLLPTGLLDPPGMDRFDLERFVTAQADVYDGALAELRAGRKQGHWMWFVFPQVAGLGHSATAQQYAIGSWYEARAYLRHPVLADRLEECTRAVAEQYPTRPEEIFGQLDAIKFRSCMTLFNMASDRGPFQNAMDLHWFGQRDERTVEIIEGWWGADE